MAARRMAALLGGSGGSIDSVKSAASAESSVGSAAPSDEIESSEDESLGSMSEAEAEESSEEEDSSDDEELQPEPEQDPALTIDRLEAEEAEEAALLATLRSLRTANRAQRSQLGCVQARLGRAKASNVLVRLGGEADAAHYSAYHTEARVEQQLWMMYLGPSSPQWAPMTCAGVRIQAWWRSWRTRHGSLADEEELARERRRLAAEVIQLVARVRAHRRLLAVPPAARRWFRVGGQQCVATAERSFRPFDLPDDHEMTLLEVYDECARRGVSTYGAKEEMLERLYPGLYLDYLWQLSPGMTVQAFEVDDAIGRVRWMDDVAGQLRSGQGLVWDIGETRGGWVSVVNSLGEELLQEVNPMEGAAAYAEAKRDLAMGRPTVRTEAHSSIACEVGSWFDRLLLCTGVVADIWRCVERSADRRHAWPGSSRRQFPAGGCCGSAAAKA